jgi:hypothetical protein
MRLSNLLAVLCIAVVAGCAHGESASSSQSAAPSSGKQAAPETAVSGVGPVIIPQYPGSQPSCGQSFDYCLSETIDSFQTVYNWYKAHLPAGSEQQLGNVMQKPAADFRVGNADVLINTPNAGKTQMNISDDRP